ncbi:unnamed protein product [marine sediment metagenome]|uniref:Uncharacterized protein n=1 Tax=marine sediment metagenome TaxID=412755 RepID=X1AB50_9ZZZZ
MVITPLCYITTDEDYSFYRRSSEDCWEIAMGESWEPVYAHVEIEALFQKHILKEITENK